MVAGLDIIYVDGIKDRHLLIAAGLDNIDVESLEESGTANTLLLVIADLIKIDVKGLHEARFGKFLQLPKELRGLIYRYALNIHREVNFEDMNRLYLQ